MRHAQRGAPRSAAIQRVAATAAEPEKPALQRKLQSQKNHAAQ
jgi:hypothetical protein